MLECAGCPGQCQGSCVEQLGAAFGSVRQDGGFLRIVKYYAFDQYIQDGAEVFMVSGPEQTGSVQQPMLLFQVSSASSGIFFSSVGTAESCSFCAPQEFPRAYAFTVYSSGRRERREEKRREEKRREERREEKRREEKRREGEEEEKEKRREREKRREEKRREEKRREKRREEKEKREKRREERGCVETSQHLPGSEGATGELEKDCSLGPGVAGHWERLPTARGQGWMGYWAGIVPREGGQALAQGAQSSCGCPWIPGSVQGWLDRVWSN
ncbi:hypothetical protein DUI87_11905 [Hirundo rustica rustica]|uniref:Uncharacterized protein n=1 Tax=Hirundo rustica rustica TaxID=333673 RepID=A0A3M0KLF1_HIRRU|nr:hypothetical protein DUI87_11905 [Hirundo rustica rustica]